MNSWKSRFPWWRRLLCAVGLHYWWGQTCDEGYEIHGCRCCPKMRARQIDPLGVPREPWQPYEPEREQLEGWNI